MDTLEKANSSSEELDNILKEAEEQAKTPEDMKAIKLARQIQRMTKKEREVLTK